MIIIPTIILLISTHVVVPSTYQILSLTVISTGHSHPAPPELSRFRDLVAAATRETFGMRRHPPELAHQRQTPGTGTAGAEPPDELMEFHAM